MRRIVKLAEPEILAEKGQTWLDEWLPDKRNQYRKFKYRNKAIKDALKQETGWKCVYCESKIGHNTPGDVEHKVPSSVNDQNHFRWDNLTVACTECNRRKSNYFDALKPFLDPYADDVEDRIIHHGPTMSWALGDQTAEISLKTLNLCDNRRMSLVEQKIEKLEQINELIERLNGAKGTELEPILIAQLRAKAGAKEEYSGMVLSILQRAGLI